MPQNPLQASIGNKGTTAIQGGYDQQGAFSQSSRHGKYYASAYSRRTFQGGNQAGATLSAALATTYVGLCLSNPAASTVNLVLKRVSGIVIVAPAAFLGLGLITGWAAGGITVHTTALDADILNTYVGAAASAGSVVAAASAAHLDAACTLVGTPLWTRWFMSEAATAQNPQFDTDMDDAIIIPPGGYAAVGGTVAGPAAGFLGSFEWEELAP